MKMVVFYQIQIVAKGKTLYKTNGNNYYFGMYMGASFF